MTRPSWSIRTQVALICVALFIAVALSATFATPAPNGPPTVALTPAQIAQNNLIPVLGSKINLIPTTTTTTTIPLTPEQAGPAACSAFHQYQADMANITSSYPGMSDEEILADDQLSAMASADLQDAVRDGLRATLANVQAAAKAEATARNVNGNLNYNQLATAEASVRADNLFTTACRGMK